MSSEVPAGAVTPRHADAIAGFLEGAGDPRDVVRITAATVADVCEE